jgi:hypothetical protein
MSNRIRFIFSFSLVVMLAACSGNSVVVPTTAPTDKATKVPAIAPTNTTAPKATKAPVITPTVQLAGEATYTPVIVPVNFTNKIDNSYMPLVPGTTFVYEGTTEDGNEHNETAVSSDTKVIMGVTCVVVNDKVLVDGTLVEATIDWYAQDNKGNVWYFGEDSKEYESGKVVSTAGSWEAGVNGALPGIVMQANPTVGQTYRQEYLKSEAEDWASVLSLSETLTIPTGTYKDVLLTNEWSALDNPPIYEHKYYAKGVGFLMTKYVVGGFETKLIEIRTK